MFHWKSVPICLNNFSVPRASFHDSKNSTDFPEPIKAKYVGVLLKFQKDMNPRGFMEITIREKKNSDQAPPLGPCWQVCLAKQHTSLRTRSSVPCFQQSQEYGTKPCSSLCLATNPFSFNGLPLSWGHKSPLQLLYQHESHVCRVPQSPLTRITEQWRHLVPVLEPRKIPIYIEGRWVCIKTVTCINIAFYYSRPP